MRVSRDQAKANRTATVAAAANLFRELGYDGIGIAGLMEAVGQTHGAFYKQFGSKDDLFAQAIGQAAEDTEAIQARQLAKPAGLAAMVQVYLSAAHREDTAKGCPFATMAVDAARRGPEVRAAVETGLEARIALLAPHLAGTEAEQRAEAMAMLSTLVGAMVLARGVNDPAFSDEILAAARAALVSGD